MQPAPPCAHCGALDAPAIERASETILKALAQRRIRAPLRWRSQKGGARFTFRAPAPLSDDQWAELNDTLDLALERAGFALQGLSWRGSIPISVAINITRGGAR